MFRLIGESGEDVSPGERGLLLYKGGTVCSGSVYSGGDIFNNFSAKAICREMGYIGAVSWTTGDYQMELDITLAAVRRDSDDWKSCTVSTTPLKCSHRNDVLLTCSGV